jgi:hypothetical protein
MAQRHEKKIDTLPGSGPFESLLGRLVRVPKAKIEAEERKYKAMRKRLKAEKERRGRQTPECQRNGGRACDPLPEN